MQARTKWTVVSLVSVLAGAGLWLGQSKTESSASLIALARLSPHDEAIYEVSVKLQQNQPGQGESTALLLKGELKQLVDASGAYRSQWTRVDEFAMLGQDAMSSRQSLMDHPVVSTFDPQKSRYQHMAASAAPELMQKLQANILDKILLPLAPSLRPALEGTHEEIDDIGAYTVSYATEAKGELFAVKKKWLRYAQKDVTIEAGEDLFSYEVNKDGRLARLEGRLGLDLRSVHYLSEIKVVLKGSAAPRAMQTAGQSLKTIDTQATQTAPMEPQLSYEESLQQLDALKEDSPSADAYQIFSSLKQDLLVHPDHGEEVAARILATTGRDASSKRRMTVLFGALAQSDSSRHADLLADIAKQCTDSFCRVQALVAISDHKQTTSAAADVVLEIAAQKGDAEVQATALLAAGSIGQKLSTPQLPALLTGQLNDPTQGEMKSTVLAAMGNHGSAEYLPTLRSYLEAKNVNQRAAAVYSLRNIPQTETILLDILEAKQDKSVVSEAFKALEYRPLSQAHYQTLVQKSLLLKDEDLQRAAARTLVHAFEREPEKVRDAFDTFAAQTEFAGVRAYMNDEIKPATQP